VIVKVVEVTTYTGGNGAAVTYVGTPARIFAIAIDYIGVAATSVVTITAPDTPGNFTSTQAAGNTDKVVYPRVVPNDVNGGAAPAGAAAVAPIVDGKLNVAVTGAGATPGTVRVRFLLEP
jgi:hypothetical protein